MKEKEAREINSEWKRYRDEVSEKGESNVDWSPDSGDLEFEWANGYLEALEKAKVLENGLKRAWIHRHGHHPCCMDEFRETLAQWEKEK